MLHLFDAVGIELEYMIVDAATLEVRPVCDQLLQAVNGAMCSDWENDRIAWSNELVMHVVELKTNGPARSWDDLDHHFHQNILLANDKLKALGCQLLPTAVHPFMDPYTQTRIWPYDAHEVYELYDRIFGCKGHGWANLQSMHINLPFANDDEFGKLHAAIRLIMPMLPALFASSPMLDGRFTGFADSRLEMYRHNQAKIPSITGLVVPEPVFTKADYSKHIFDPIIRDICPFDTNGVLDKHFLNSRGCIARFDRGAIEIRVLDLQEAPIADLALARFVVEVVKWLVDGHWINGAAQRQVSSELLHAQLLETIKNGGRAKVFDGYTQLFGIQHPITAQEFWQFILLGVDNILPVGTEAIVSHIIEKGCLSQRIEQVLGENPSPQQIVSVYKQLGNCLEMNKLFDQHLFKEL